MSGLELQIYLPLDRFQLDVRLDSKAQVTGVFGASGSGKTSLLETIAGLRRKARGHIRFEGEVWLDSSKNLFKRPEKRCVGLVPQDGLLFPHKNVRENLLAGEKRARRSHFDLKKTMRDVVELLELEPLLEQAPMTLSGGERQRVALGRALCSGAGLLLLDEPLAALDLPLRRRLLPYLKRVSEEFRVPTLLVSHDPIEVQALCQDVLVLHEGSTLARGTPLEVLTDPAVYPLAERESFENVLRATMVESHETKSQVRLGRDGPVLIMPPVQGTRDETLLVGLAANQILIATKPPEGLSARNILAAEVLSVRRLEAGELVLVRVHEEVEPITVEVTEAAFLDLGLKPGAAVFLVIKASSLRPYGSPVERAEPSRRSE